MADISLAQFTDRFVALVLDARDLPKKAVDFNLLLYSATLGIEPGRTYSEAEVSDELERWILLFGRNFGLDHVTLRRFLIDGKYLRRDPAGTAYQLDPAGPRFTFDPAIRSVDLEALLAEARRERELRKQDHLRRSDR